MVNVLKSVGDDGLQRGSSPRVSERFAVLIRHPRYCWEVFGLIRRDILAKTGLLAPFSCSDVAPGIGLGLPARKAPSLGAAGFGSGPEVQK